MINSELYEKYKDNRIIKYGIKRLKEEQEFIYKFNKEIKLEESKLIDADAGQKPKILENIESYKKCIGYKEESIKGIEDLINYILEYYDNYDKGGEE